MNTNENNNNTATAQELAAQQQEREARALKVATIIYKQITAAPADIWQSWAMEHPAAIVWEGRTGLIFRVNGLQHQGNVIATLDEGRDLYDVRTLTDKGETLQERTGIFCDELAHVIDTMVERPEGMTDEEYTAALRALNDPFTDFVLSKAEQGQRAHVVQF